MTRRAASNFGRTNTATVAPLTAAQIRECEERLGLVGSGAKTSSHCEVGERGRGGRTSGDFSSVSIPSHPQGVIPSHPSHSYPPPTGERYDVGSGRRGRGEQTPSPLLKSERENVGERGRTKTAKAKKPLVTIIEDTREQTPFTKWPEWVAVESGTCHTGDYTVKGWENCFCIERKSLKDFAGTMLGGYEASSEKPKKRFNRELERMRHYDLKAVVVVASPRELIEFRHNCGMDAHGALWGFATSIFANYGIPVFPIEGEELAARFVADLARHYIVARTKKNFTKEDKSLKAIAEWGF